MRTFDQDSASDRFGRYFRGMLERGICFPCSQFAANLVSVCHTDKGAHPTINAANEVFAEIIDA